MSLEFETRDHVFLKVSLMKDLMRFRKKKNKLNPHFIGLFEILERVGTTAYQLALPLELANIHNVFHISMLRKYHPDPSHVLRYENIPIEKDILSRDTHRHIG